MNNATVIGAGMVGNATAKLFGIKDVFDIDAEKSTITMEEASKKRLIFICVPTPVDPQGNYNTDAIRDTILQLEEYGNGGIYIIRSTVFPGYALALQKELSLNRIISNPEFLTESTWKKDIKNPPFILIGGLEGVFMNDVKAAYSAVIKGANFILTDNTSAEMAKLALNGFFATKVVYANAIYDYCQKVDGNYESVKKVLESHPFGYKNHSDIFHQDGRGAGGKCLRKDVEALSYYSGQDIIDKIKRANVQYLNESNKQ